MRIGIVALGRLSEDTGGKNYILHSLRTLSSVAQRDEFVLFLSEGEAERLELPTYPFLRIRTVPNSRRTPFHKVIGEQIVLPRLLREESLDLVYYPGNFVSLRSRIPAVVNIRATAHFYGSKYGIRGTRRWVRAMLMPASARRAAAIIAPSEDIKRDIVRFTDVPSEKITVIPHGVDLSLFDGERNREDPAGFEVLDRFGLTPGPYLLYVSALWRYKNQDSLIRAHARLVSGGWSDLKLVLAGKGTGTEARYLRELEALPRKLGTEGLVVFTGAQPQSLLRYLYAHAAAFVFPSRYESFGNPLFEAWSSGIPVLASNVHSFPEVTSGAALLFDPESNEAMASSIERLLRDSLLREELVTKGHERAKNFSWESCVERTLALLRSVSPQGEVR